MIREEYSVSSVEAALRSQPSDVPPAPPRSILRSLAKCFLILLKPVFLPFFSRLRGYFNRPLLEQANRLEAKMLGLEQQTLAGQKQLLSAIAELVGSMSARLDRIEQYTFASARRIAVGASSGEVLIRSEVGYILCDASDHAVLACLLDSGDLERGTRLLIQRYLRPNDIFIDIGANLGLHTLAAARAMQGQGRIIAFEPFARTQRLLAESVRINGFSQMVEIHQTAISNHTGRQTLFMGASSGHHSLYELATEMNGSSQTVDVSVARLGDIVPDSTPVNLIKIDVEGAELEVLQGARALIVGNPSVALIVEFGYSHLQRTGRSTQEWLDAFKDLGLVYQVINDTTGLLQSWTSKQLEAVESVNLLFALPQSEAWSRAGVVV